TDTYPTPATKATTITVAGDSVVVTGAPAVGQTVIATFADLDNDNDATQGLTYHWLRDGVAIEGQNAATYLVTASDPGHLLSVAAFEGSHLEATSTAVTVVSSLLEWKGPASGDWASQGRWGVPPNTQIATFTDDTLVDSSVTVTVDTHRASG